MLVELEERAREDGFERLELVTNGQLRAARKLYEKHGYEETNRETHPVTGDEFVRFRKEFP